MGLPADRLINERLTPRYLKAQIGVLLLPVGLCLFREAVSRRIVQLLGQDGGPWFWTGTLSLICINAGIG